MLFTGMRNRRATTLWASSCSTIDAKKAATLAPAIQRCVHRDAPSKAAG